MAEHLWWECPAYEDIRGQPCFAELAQADRSRWPSCTRVHGVIVKGKTVDAAALHRLMGAIYIARREAERQRNNLPPPMHAWTAAATLVAKRHDFDFSRLPDAPPRWTYGDRTMRALKGWLAALRWTAGEVSNIELALDFEIFTGVNVPGPPDGGSIPVNQRGKTLWTMLSALCRVCEDLRLPSPLPAERATRVGCLRTLGAPMVWGGLTRRPQFAAGLETSQVIEACLPRAINTAGISDRNWGGDVFPLYNNEQRVLRARQWDAPTPTPARPTRPTPVPATNADPSLRTQSVCDACAKQKCSLCASMRRNYSLTVNQCCQVHHRPGDGLKVQCCRTHLLTRCGACPNAASCCSKGHHEATPVSGHASDVDNEGGDSCPSSPASPSTTVPPRQHRRAATDRPTRSSKSNDKPSRAGSKQLPLLYRKGAVEGKGNSSSLSYSSSFSFSSDTPNPSPSRVLPPRRRRKSDPVGVT